MGASLGCPLRESRSGAGAGAGAGAGRSTSFRAIPDRFKTEKDVRTALQQAGVESCNLIVGVDFTKSNTWTGDKCFDGRSLHDTGVLNPYTVAISLIGRTLAELDDDNLIPAYGFGCSRTGDRAVFSFMPGDAPLHGFPAVLDRYQQLAGAVRMAGPTSFGPIVDQAAAVARANQQFSVLLLLCDGQVTRSVDTPRGSFSVQEEDTRRAIVEASRSAPLAIVIVGVGDGPFGMLEELDDFLPERDFDNVQFVNLARHLPHWRKADGATPAERAAFALAALMELPDAHGHCLARLRVPAGGHVRAVPPPLDPPILAQTPARRPTAGDPGVAVDSDPAPAP